MSGSICKCDDTTDALATEERDDSPQPLIQIGMRRTSDLAIFDPVEPGVFDRWASAHIVLTVRLN